MLLSIVLHYTGCDWNWMVHLEDRRRRTRLDTKRDKYDDLDEYMRVCKDIRLMPVYSLVIDSRRHDTKGLLQSTRLSFSLRFHSYLRSVKLVRLVIVIASKN